MPNDPLAFDHERVLANVRQAGTEDLLNRITAYRDGMEPEAIEMIEDELRQRGVTAADIAAHAEQVRNEVIFLPDGIAATCSRCNLPAVAQAWGWFRLFRKIPLFPRREYYCRVHAPSV
jgi:hypothetical protein